MTKENATLDVQERILHVARELFIKNGFNGTSIRDIAAASETNVAMVNYYFRSKYNLFEIIFEEAFEVLISKLFTVINSNTPFSELIKLWITSYYEILAEYPQIPIFILNEINQNPDRLSKLINTRNPYKLFKKLSKRIEKEVKEGNIREIPSLDFILNVMSLCVFPFMFGELAIKVTGKTQNEYTKLLDQHKNYVIEFVFNALRP